MHVQVCTHIRSSSQKILPVKNMHNDTAHECQLAKQKPLKLLTYRNTQWQIKNKPVVRSCARYVLFVDGGGFGAIILCFGRVAGLT